MKISFILLALFFFSGCSFKEKTLSSEPLHVTLKNNSFKISDTGFINKKEDSYNLQVFSAGTVVLDLKIYKDSICSDFGCTNKRSFNQEFLGYEHYESLLEDILEFKPLYEKDFKEDEIGFIQILKDENFNIIYRVNKKSVHFKDTKNKVLLKIKKLKK